MASLARSCRPIASTLRQSTLQQNAALRAASFHTTSKKALLPVGPRTLIDLSLFLLSIGSPICHEHAQFFFSLLTSFSPIQRSSRRQVRAQKVALCKLGDSTHPATREYQLTIYETVNDPTSWRDGDPAHGSYHWTFDRLLALGLVPLTVAPFAAGSLNPGLDAVLCATVLVHSHLGFQNIVEDYVPTRTYPKSRKACNIGLGAATLLAGVGLYEFETNDVGVTEAIKRVWKA